MENQIGKTLHPNIHFIVCCGNRIPLFPCYIAVWNAASWRTSNDLLYLYHDILHLSVFLSPTATQHHSLVGPYLLLLYDYFGVFNSNKSPCIPVGVWNSCSSSGCCCSNFLQKTQRFLEASNHITCKLCHWIYFLEHWQQLLLLCEIATKSIPCTHETILTTTRRMAYSSSYRILLSHSFQHRSKAAMPWKIPRTQALPWLAALCLL